MCLVGNFAYVKYTISLDVHDTIFKPSDQKMLETCVSVTVGKICVTFCDKPLVASALTYLHMYMVNVYVALRKMW